MTPIQFAPLKRMHEQLIGAKVDEATAAVILGKVLRTAQEAAGLKIAAELGEERFKEISAVEGEEQQFAALSQAYTEKTGKPADTLFEEMLEKVVQDFEKS